MHTMCRGRLQKQPHIGAQSVRRPSRLRGRGAEVGLPTLFNLISNIAEETSFLKYITPFGYCDGADIVSGGSLDGHLIAIGAAIGIAGIAAAYLKYIRKDIH